MTLRDVVVAAIGALIAGGVAIFLDQRRRKDERKSRFLDEKRHAYKAVLRFSSLLAEDLLLIAGALPILARVPDDEAFAPVELRHLKALVKRVKGNLPKYEEDLTDAVTELTLLDPTSTRAAHGITQVLKNMTGHLTRWRS